MRTEIIVKHYQYFDEQDRENIIKQMKNLGLTLDNLAVKIKKSKNYVYKLLAGTTKLNDKYLLAMEKMGIKIGVKI